MSVSASGQKNCVGCTLRFLFFILRNSPFSVSLNMNFRLKVSRNSRTLSTITAMRVNAHAFSTCKPALGKTILILIGGVKKRHHHEIFKNFLSSVTEKNNVL